MEEGENGERRDHKVTKKTLFDNAKNSFHRFTKTFISERSPVQKSFSFTMGNVMVSCFFQEASGLSSNTEHNATWQNKVFRSVFFLLP